MSPEADAFDDLDAAPPSEGMTAGAGSGVGRLQKARQAQAQDADAKPPAGPVDGFTDEELAKLGADVVADWEADQADDKEWRERAEEALEAAAQEGDGEKSHPWPNASNVRYPLLTVASLQFAARAYPAIVKGDEAVQAKVFGPDPQGVKAARGQRVADFLNYKLFYAVDGWEEDTDAMLHVLPCVGQHYRKVYVDPITKAPCIESVSALRLTVPKDARSLRTSPRVTHDYDMFPNDIAERMKAGVWADVELGPADAEKQASRVILEQHRLMDVDGDGLEEPYIVTVDKLTTKVLRIDNAWHDKDVTWAGDGEDAVPVRIDRWMPFVSYAFVPDPKGRVKAIGFGHLLGPIMDVVNSTINMLIDSGHAAAAGGGFVGAEVRLQGAGKNGVLRFGPGEYKTVNASGDDLRNAIWERTLPQPSPVLFRLLTMLMDAAQKIASVNDAITGDAARTAPVGTTLALIEQGQQVFNAIYKRVYRALREEYRLFMECLARWGDPDEYAKFFDVGQGAQMGHNGGPPMEAEAAQPPAPGQPQAAPQAPPPAASPAPAPISMEADFKLDDLDIRPVSDPSAVTKMQQMAKMQVALGFLGKGVFADDRAVVRQMLSDAGIEQAEAWIPEQAPTPPPPNPLQMQMMALQAALLDAKGKKTTADAQVAIAKAAQIAHEASGSAAQLDAHAKAAMASVDLAAAAEKMIGLNQPPGATK